MYGRFIKHKYCTFVNNSFFVKYLNLGSELAGTETAGSESSRTESAGLNRRDSIAGTELSCSEEK